MCSLTELADQLSFTVTHTDDTDTGSEFTVDEEQHLLSSIRKFVTSLNQYPSDYQLSCSHIVHGLNLACHPEGGFYRRFSWTKEKSKTFYLLPADCVSSWHHFQCIRETWKWIYGGTLIVPQISNEFQWLGEAELSKDKDVVIMEECNSAKKWGNWFGAYHRDCDFSLIICECTPPFEFSKFELAKEQDVNKLKVCNPTRVDIIELLAKKKSL